MSLPSPEDEQLRTLEFLLQDLSRGVLPRAEDIEALEEGGRWRDLMRAIRGQWLDERKSSIDHAVNAVAENERRVHEDRLRVSLLERASADLADVQAQLLQAGKLASLGTLAAGIAHELNQPLTVIMGLVDLIRECPGDPVEEHDDALDRVGRAARRMSEIVRKINTFARQDAFTPRRIPAELPLCEARDLVKDVLLSQRVKFTTEIDPNAGDVLADPGRMQQVFMNLIGNARDAVLELPEEEREVRLTLKREVDWVRYEVADAGFGVAEALADQIFDPFFTTKAPGKGTGLGLSLSLSIVADHEGGLSYSREGGWTRFVVRLPPCNTHSFRAIEARP